MSRISILNVEYYLDRLNSRTKNYYALRKSGSPTGYTLTKRNKYGGEKDISRNGLSTTEVYEVVYAINNILWEEEHGDDKD